MVLDVEDLDAVPARGAHDLQRLGVTEAHGRKAEAVVLVGEPRDDHDEVQAGPAAQRGGEDPGDVGRPQVLVLDVDEATGSPQRLGVPAGGAAFPAGANG